MGTAMFSMTGFGEGRASERGVEVVVELRSVNHRFLDVVTRLPSAYTRFETEIIKRIRGALKRGRVDVYVSRKESTETDVELRFNKSLFDIHLAIVREAFRAAEIDLGQGEVAAVLSILEKREVVELAAKEGGITSESVEQEGALLNRALGEALNHLITMRSSEGEVLEAEVLSLLVELEAVVGRIAQFAKDAPEEFRDKLLARLSKLLPELGIDPDRLAQEAAVLSDKIDITEEIARLGSHFAQFRQIVACGEGGRKLDFLLQEFGREINTVGSKVQNSAITALVVEAKALVEKLKEQVANIE